MPRHPCDHCGAEPAQGIKFQKCKACRKPSYCSKECQGAAWPAHKADCAPRLECEIIKVGDTAETSTKKGTRRPITLQQCQETLGCRLVQMVPSRNGSAQFVMDDEGKIVGKPFNVYATERALAETDIDRRARLAGTVMIVPAGLVE